MGDFVSKTLTDGTDASWSQALTLAVLQQDRTGAIWSFEKVKSNQCRMPGLASASEPSIAIPTGTLLLGCPLTPFLPPFS